MCDRCCQCCWSKRFYKQYLEQHSAMMQWIQQGTQPYEGYLQTPNPSMMESIYQDNQPIEGYSPNPAVAYPFYSFMNSETNQLHEEPLQFDCKELIPSNQKKRTRQFSSSSSVSSSERSDVSRDDIIGSDDEIYFDPGCFLELGNNKDSLSEKSDNDEDEEEEEEFEVIDSVVEEFEYVQLDRFGNMSESRKGGKGRPRAEAEMKIEKETREYFYGEKADTIAGLETAMSLDFNRLCDLHQPHLWPVLPVRLSKA